MWDITIFNRSDITQLTDCLVDIKTVADLSVESWTQLAQAKSKVLTQILITEALTSAKYWDDIKDLLHLKICNSDIHTSVNHFMEIFITLKEKPKDVTLPVVLPP